MARALPLITVSSILIFFSSVCIVSAATVTSVEYYNQGLEYNFIGRYDAAILSFDTALNLQPNYADAWIDRGHALYNLGRYEEALESYNKSLEIDPDLFQVWYYKADVYTKLHQYDDEQFCYLQGQIVNRKSGRTLPPTPNRAYSEHTFGVSEEVKKVFDEGLEFQNQNNYEAALASYEEVIDMDSGIPEAWNNRGIALFSLGRYEEALVSYDTALSIRKYHPAYINRGQVLAKLGRYDEAITSSKKAIELVPLSGEPWNGLGRVYHAMGRYEDAIACYNKTIQLYSHDDNLWPFEQTTLDEAIALRENAISGRQKNLDIASESPPLTPAGQQTQKVSLMFGPLCEIAFLGALFIWRRQG